MPDVDIASLDFRDDPRPWSAPDDMILIPSLRDRNLRRIAYEENGWWFVEGVHTSAASLPADASGDDLQAFETMEEALYAVLGEPVELPDPDDVGEESFHLIVEAGDDPIIVTFEREDKETEPFPWYAYVSQPAPDRYPAHFTGNTPLEALMHMYGVRVADDGSYEYTPGS